MKIGILGGTFDPIHIGHLKIAECAIKSLALDKLILMPCFIPPHKDHKITCPEDRLKMVKLAIEGHAGLEVSDYEITKRGISFSFDMLTDFKKTHPKDEIFFIMGSDSYKEFATWKNYTRIPELARLAIVQRPNSLCSSGGKAIELEMEASDISSSAIRASIGRREPVEGLVPDAVNKYILDKGLYHKLDNS